MGQQLVRAVLVERMGLMAYHAVTDVATVGEEAGMPQLLEAMAEHLAEAAEAQGLVEAQVLVVTERVAKSVSLVGR